MTDVADFIRKRVSAYQAGEALGLKPNRYGRCACPVHHGKDRNCNLDKGDRGFFCHVCKTGGDVMKLVMETNQCSFPEAVAWLNSAFGLGLDLDKPNDEKAKERALLVKEWRQHCRKLDADADKAMYESYLDIGGWINRMERDAAQYRPKSPDDEWDERFVNALRWLPTARDQAEWIATSVIGVKT